LRRLAIFLQGFSDLARILSSEVDLCQEQTMNQVGIKSGLTLSTSPRMNRLRVSLLILLGVLCLPVLAMADDKKPDD
jgi:hypothetical protein